MKSPVFTGAATALITPLDENGIDYNALARLIDWQIESGINALVVCGTTGESLSLIHISPPLFLYIFYSTARKKSTTSFLLFKRIFPVLKAIPLTVERYF